MKQRVLDWCRGHPLVGIPLLSAAVFFLVLVTFWAANWLMYWLPQPPRG